ncbi:hypothetical protein [Larkinella rosea]|uniref:Outer membrane protein beta-barrel domain-containing protein n=1 Tax=Larkinella rosea TaxID=2025312 RepID=A0A3P1BZB4_9BACT|nr:hypothetical protein [Larkinella rosea]RRB06322.1 hypothetical protein EHT25_00510 [Larkinella rosea]
MKKLLISLLFGGLLTGGHLPKTFGQAADKIVFGGVTLERGVGRYNPITFGVGAVGQFQYPLTPVFAVTAKAGVEVFLINFSSLNPYSYLGYGYNPISGFGFNTLYVNYAMMNARTTGISVPLCVGPRAYLTDRLHADALVGADVGASEVMRTSLRVEPGVGYMLPLPQGRFLDVNASYCTSFARGSGVVSLGISYGFKIK